jgi:ribosomal protein S12 methylthiotransferase accessory factor
MMEARGLSDYVHRGRSGVPVQLWTDRAADESGDGPGPRIVLLARESGLAIVPVSAQTRPAIEGLLSFANEFAGFPAYRRKWTWSSVLEVQICAAIDRTAEALAEEPARHGFFYLYLNGGFCKKYFPADDCEWTRADAAPALYEDGCRARTPAIEQILRVFGTASVLGTTLRRTPGNDSFHCYSAHDRLLGIGRGNSDRQMMCGAVFEYCERWVGQTMPPSVVFGTYIDLASTALRPDQVADVVETLSAELYPGYRRDLRLGWIAARFLQSGAACLLPLPMVNYLLEPTTLFSYTQNSNGCALGNSCEEAALFGALEVIERDALLLTWYSKSAPPRFRLASFGCVRINELLHLASAAGYEVACFDMTTEFGVPTVLVLLLGRSEQQLAAFVTAACHPNPRTAVRSALAEAYSLLGSAERNFRRHAQRAAQSGASMDHLRDNNQALFYGQWEQRHHFDFLREAPETLLYADFVTAHPFVADSPAQVLHAMGARASALGYDVIVADNTPPALARLGLRSARVFIPGTIAVTFGDKPVGIPRRRLARAARACSWVNPRADLSDLRLHPLG